MMKQVKIFRLLVSGIVCLALLAAGCAPSGEEPARAGVELEKQIPPAPVFRQEDAGVELVLKFTPQDLTTYKVITDAQRGIKWEGPLPDKSDFKGGTTGNRIEMTFTQQIQSVDDKGSAVAKITIKGLKYLDKVKDSVALDFDSAREKDQNSPLFKLIGQGYTIELTPAGQVSKVIDVKQAQAAVGGSSSANKIALSLLRPDVIKDLHTISALPGTDKNQLRTGDSWSSLKTFFFGMMGSKSYEKIYTLKEIKDADGRHVAVIEMDAIPSAEMAEEMRREQARSFFSKMFDSTETYTGQLILDLTAGKVEKYIEDLRCEWVAVDPSAGQKADIGPAVLRMTATRFYRIEKVD